MKNLDAVEQLSFSDAFFPVPDVSPDVLADEKVIKRRRPSNAKDYMSRQYTLTLDYLFGTLIDDVGAETEGLEETYTWTDENILLIHERILESTLSLIADSRASISNRLKSIEWVYSDPIIEVNEALKRPLSFQACCIVSYVDPVRVRDGLVHVIKGTKLWDSPAVQEVSMINN